jgi:hypothetical protein
MRKEEGGIHIKYRKNNKLEKIDNDNNTTKLFECSILAKNIYHCYADFIIT